MFAIKKIPSLLLWTLSVLPSLSTAAEVRLYTERHYEADKTIFAQFTEKTGIEVKVVKAGANELMARMKAETKAPQADLYLAVDAASLARASKANLLTAIEEEKLAERFPANLLPESKHWIPLTMRARVIVASKERVPTNKAPRTYEDLAKPAWRGQILVRSSSSHYNQSLLASILAADGKAKGFGWAQGVKDNMARPPQGNDRDQVRSVALGLGDLAITNSYYLGLLEQSDEENDRKARAAVNVIFPNQEGRGCHVNISGAGLIKGADYSKEALELLLYLTSPEVQAQYQTLTSEFAAIKGVEPTELQKAWGTFKPDFTNLHKLVDFQQEAVKVFDQVGWQ